jgi:hypothetical protein
MMPRRPNLASYLDIVMAQPGPGGPTLSPGPARQRELVRYGLTCAEGVTVRDDEQ